METANFGKKQILVLEDEPVIAQIFQRVINGLGLTVDMAANGKIAQELLEFKDYELLIFDIRTPQMNGKELYLWLQGKYPVKAGKVVFTTGDTVSGNTQSFLESSGRPFLPKPFTPGELRNFIKRNIGGTK